MQLHTCPRANGKTWARPTAAPPPARGSRARERPPASGYRARLAATHRAAGPGG
ncbi:MAG: hypothetical protein PHQ34_01200 [Methanothrix sp.]|nr:hypothetical protein [Methanothrix sp.]